MLPAASSGFNSGCEPALWLVGTAPVMGEDNRWTPAMRCHVFGFF